MLGRQRRDVAAAEQSIEWPRALALNSESYGILQIPFYSAAGYVMLPDGLVGRV